MIKAISLLVPHIINSSPTHSLSNRWKPLSSFPWTSVITFWPRSTTCWGPESTWRRPRGKDWRRWAKTSNTWQGRATSGCSPAAPHSSAVKLLINAGARKRKKTLERRGIFWCIFPRMGRSMCTRSSTAQRRAASVMLNRILTVKQTHAAAKHIKTAFRGKKEIQLDWRGELWPRPIQHIKVTVSAAPTFFKSQHGMRIDPSHSFPVLIGWI